MRHKSASKTWSATWLVEEKKEKEKYANTSIQFDNKKNSQKLIHDVGKNKYLLSLFGFFNIMCKLLVILLVMKKKKIKLRNKNKRKS